MHVEKTVGTWFCEIKLERKRELSKNNKGNKERVRCFGVWSFLQLKAKAFAVPLLLWN